MKTYIKKNSRRINKITRLLTLYNTDITLDGYSIAEKEPIKETILKYFLTIMMVHSSFKTAFYNWSHINSPKNPNIEEEYLPLGGG